METTHVYQVVRETWLTREPRGSAFLVAALATLFLCLTGFVYELNLGDARDWMAASGEAVFNRGESWRLLTTIFAHADLGHLMANSLLFFVLGFFLYGHFGPLLFPVLALVGGVMTNWIALKTYDPKTVLIGASGVVYWMGGAWLVLYFFLSRQKNLTQRILRTLGVAILLFMPHETFEPSVSYRTHFAGFGVGALTGLLQYATFRSTYLAAEVRETIVETDDPVLEPIETEVVNDQSST